MIKIDGDKIYFNGFHVATIDGGLHRTEEDKFKEHICNGSQLDKLSFIANELDDISYKLEEIIS